MSDDIYKKLSKLINDLTGSLDKNTEVVSKNETTDIENSIFSKLIDSVWIEDQIAAAAGPSYVLIKPESGDYHWLFNSKTKTLDRFSENTEVIPIAYYDDDYMICAIGASEYKVASNLLKCIGYH